MKFKPGESGNPGGRKPGTLTRAGRLRESIAKDLPEIVAKLAESAKAGDVQAARLLMDRALPALRATDAPVSLPPGVDLSDLAGAPVAVLKALAAGALSPDQAATIAGALSALAKVREFTELESRISALEAKQ